MLDMLRKSAGSWVAKGLFVLLILSFGIWGIGDVIRNGGGSQSAITVGDIEISPQTVRQQFEQKVSQMRRVLGDQLTTDMARKMGFLQATVRDLVNGATIDMTASDLGITVSDDGVKAEIAKSKGFQDEKGVFSATRFRSLLAQNGYTEKRYVNELREDMLRRRLVSTISGGVAVPQALAEPLFQFANEQRVAETLTVHPDTLSVAEKPSDDDLQKLYHDHLEAYTAPEYRSLTALVLRKDDLASRIEVSDQAIADNYQANQDQYQVPERRVLSQVVAPDEATAKAVADKAAEGKTLAAAAKDAGAPAPVDTGAISKTDLPADAAKVVFAATKGAITQPVQTQLGWHVFQIKDIEPGRTKTLDEVKDQIAASIRSEQAIDKLYDVANEIEDMLGGGDDIPSIAKKLDLKTVALKDVDADGTPADAKTVDAAGQALLKGTNGLKQILSLGFAQEQSETSRVEEYDGGYVVVTTNTVTPPTARPFDTVRDQVQAQWTAQKQAEQAKTLAQSLLKKVKDGASLQSLATPQSVTFSRHAAVTRNGKTEQDDKGLSAPLIRTLFTLKSGDAALVDNDNGDTVVRLDKIISADSKAEANSAALENEKTSLAQSLGNDLASEAINALGQRYGVKVNQAAVESTF